MSLYSILLSLLDRKETLTITNVRFQTSSMWRLFLLFVLKQVQFTWIKFLFYVLSFRNLTEIPRGQLSVWLDEKFSVYIMYKYHITCLSYHLLITLYRSYPLIHCWLIQKVWFYVIFTYCHWCFYEWIKLCVAWWCKCHSYV